MPRRSADALTRASGAKRARATREQLLRKRLRSKWDAIIGDVVNDIQTLPALTETVVEESPLDCDITSDGKILSKGTDAMHACIMRNVMKLKQLKAADGSISRELFAKVYDEPRLSAEIAALEGCVELMDNCAQVLHMIDFMGAKYAAGSVCWLDRCELHVVLVQAHWRRRLVLPWRRRRDIVQCLSDESSDVIESLVSDPHLTDHVYVHGTELHATRLVDLAGLIRERGAATARSKVLRRICACCGLRHAVVREKAFPVCGCGGPHHYCSVACQKAHWQTHHAKSCGRDKYHREGGNRCVLRFAFRRADGSIYDPAPLIYKRRPYYAQNDFEKLRVGAELAKKLAIDVTLSGEVSSLASKLELLRKLSKWCSES